MIFSFDEATPPVFTDFGTALGASAVVADPVAAANKVGRIVKPTDAQTWMGSTISSCAGQSIAPIPLSTAHAVVTALVYAPAAGIPVRMKLENAADGTQSVETDAVTTQTGTWETLSWDFSKNAAGTAALNPATTYSKLSLFPNFGTVGGSAAASYYVDNITFVGAVYATACPGGSGGGGSGGTLTNGVFASNYSQVDASNWKSTEGGAASTYIDTAVATQYWWNGLAANDSTPSFYFGYGINVAAKPWGFGAYVSAPGNATADVSGYSNLKLAVWGNDQLTSLLPTFTVLLQGPTVNACTSVLRSSLKVTGVGVQNYTLPLSGFTLQTACGYASAAQALAAGVTQVHVQVLDKDVQFTSGQDSGGNYPNGLNMGPVKFQ